MTFDEQLEAQRPFSRPLGEIDIEELRERAMRLGPGKLSIHDIRCLTYAHYLEKISTEEIQVPPEDIEHGVRALLKLLPPLDTPDARLVHRIVALGGLHNSAFNDSSGRSGWGLCGINLLHAIAPERLSTIAGSCDDPGHLIELFVYDHYVTPPHDVAIMDALLQAGDPFGVAIVAEKYREGLESFVIADKSLDLEHLLSAPREEAIVVLAALIARLIRNFQFPHDEGRLDRLRAAAEDVSRIARELLSGPGDVRVLVKSSNGRIADVLSLVFRWASVADFQKKAIAEMCRAGDQHFKDVFRSCLDIPAGVYPAGILITEDLVGPLVAVMLNVGLTPDRFEDLYNGLASDALSELTRDMLWRVDRPRAILLIAIGGLIAHRRNDTELLETVKRAVEHARSQRPCGQPILHACMDELTEAFGSEPPLC